MTTSTVTAANRETQRRIYGMPLADIVHRILGRTGVSQAELARTLEISASMLSQLVSAERIKVGDPTALARLITLDRLSVNIGADDPDGVREMLAAVRQIRWQLGEPATPGPQRWLGANVTRRPS